MHGPPHRGEASDDRRRSTASDLRRRGLRYTTGYQTIIDALAATARPMTIGDLINACATLPSSSTYRIVTRLQGAGVVVEVPHIGAARYALRAVVDADAQHGLAVCRVCGDVEFAAWSAHLDDAPIGADAWFRRMGFTPEWHHLAFVGRCARCQ